MTAFAQQYELFESCKKNNLKRVTELLDAGVPVDEEDSDNGNTPIHYAASNGSKQTLEFLVERGANVNAQNHRGVTPLHMLITSRYDALALWLVRKGADLHTPDRRGHTPRDLALQWFQKELDDAALGKLTKAEQESQQMEKEREKARIQIQKDIEIAKANQKAPVEEVLKIYLTNDAYKSVRVTPTMTAGDLATVMAEKLNIPLNFKSWLDVYEVQKGNPRKLTSGESLHEVRTKWPTVLGEGGVNETLIHYRFLVRVRAGAPDDVINKYASALSG